jgi:mercuric ion binding protein
MKKWISTVIISVFLSSGIAFAKQINVTVKGMVCSFCAQGIKKKFSAEKAVDQVQVDLDHHLVTLKLKEGNDLTNDTITQLLKDSGYTMEKVQRQ